MRDDGSPICRRRSRAWTSQRRNEQWRWWLNLIGRIMMIVLAFWVSGQFFLVRASTLLTFAGVWGMTTGIIGVMRAFEIRELGRQLRPRSR
jgi:hypothetical protein